MCFISSHCSSDDSRLVPCLGYVFRETTGIERKLVVLGDTCDPSSVRGLAQGCSVLVHEATDAYIPMNIDRALRGDKKTPAMVQHATVAKGHSTPAMAGAFAKAVGAQRLYLNHFSKKFVLGPCYLHCCAFTDPFPITLSDFLHHTLVARTVGAWLY